MWRGSDRLSFAQVVKFSAVLTFQRAILIKNGDEISMILSTGYTRDDQEFGWIIPTPVPLAIEDVFETGSLAESTFRELDQYSAPAVVTYACDFETGGWGLSRVVR